MKVCPESGEKGAENASDHKYRSKTQLGEKLGIL